MCIAKTARKYLELNSQKKAIEEKMGQLRPILEAEMDRQKAEKLIIPSDGLDIRISYTLKSRKGIDGKALKDIHPDIYDSFEKETIFPVLRVMV